MRSSLKFALKKGKINKAVEIGVCKGKNAEEMLKAGIKELTLVDPYIPFKVGGFHKGKVYEEDIFMVTQEEQDTNKKEMINRLTPYKDKVKFLNIASEHAAPLFPDNYFDYVYVDGNHKYESVKKDLELWFSKVKKGGTFAGHDFNKPHLGVAKAVIEFAKENNLKVVIIKQDGDWIKNVAISDWWINA